MRQTITESDARVKAQTLANNENRVVFIQPTIGEKGGWLVDTKFENMSEWAQAHCKRVHPSWAKVQAMLQDLEVMGEVVMVYLEFKGVWVGIVKGKLEDLGNTAWAVRTETCEAHFNLRTHCVTVMDTVIRFDLI